MIKYGVDGSGKSYYATVYDECSGEEVLTGDGWETPAEILDFYIKLLRGVGTPPKLVKFCE